MTTTQIGLLNRPSPSPFYRWRQIFLVLHARNILISIAGNAKKRSLTLTGEASQPSSSYTTLQTHDADAGEGAQTTPTRADITIHIPENNINNTQQPFSASINVESLTTIVKEKNLGFLCEFGGVKGIAAVLDTNLDNGICSNPAEIRLRQGVYGRNIYCLPLDPAKAFFYYFVKALKDWTIFLLLCCAALSLSAGIEKEGWKDGWYDGATIFVAVFVLVTITSLSNYRHAIKLRKSLKMNTPGIDVQRDGCLQQILISDVVVGDVVCLKIGDKVPADGLFLDGDPLQVDEEIDSTTVGDESPFLFSESKVVNGSARMLVTSVGTNTVWGETMRIVTHDPHKKTPLQRRVDKLNSYVQYVGLIFAVFILVVLILRYLFGKREDDENGYPDLKAKTTPIGDLMKSMARLVIRPRGTGSILTTLFTVFLLGVQEGLPFFISLSLCCWNKRMSVDHVIVEDLSTCVNMGSITTICIDKTGVLTFNKMEVDTFWFGEEAISKEVISSLTPEVLEVLHEGVGTPVLVPGTFSSPMEDPILPWAKMTLGMDMELLKKTRIILNPKALNSDRNRSGMLMRKNGGTEKTIHLHWKGAGEEILAMCSYYYNSEGIIKSMDQQKRLMFERIIGDMATKGLQSVAFAYKKIDKDDSYCEDVDDDVLQEEGLILLGVVGLKPEARSIVEALIHAGVSIKLVSAEDLTMLRAEAIDCGILVPDQDLDAAVLEGEKFRNLSEKERVEMVDQIRVIGSVLPSDKLLMVKCLQQKGHLVAVTGTKTSDAPALKEADIGISMGTQCSETAKENSDIIILNGSFASVATVFKSGICAYRNIRKFIQLQLTMTIAGLLINSITTVSLGDAPITTLQLFGVNLTMGTFGALALLTGQQTQTLMDVAPIPQTEPLITKAMWRNITAQALYQITVLVTFQFKGDAFPGMTTEVKKTLIFNTFILCQVFNQFNSRELEKKNVFMGILENRWFLVAVGASFVSHVVVVEFAESLAGTVKLNWEQWLACILSAVVSWPIDSVVKCIPGFPANRSNGPLGSHIGFISTPPSVPSTSESQLELPLIRDSSTRGSS